MKVLITRSTMADGRFVREGSIEDISDRDAALLIQLGKATVPVVEPEVVEAVETVEAVGVPEVKRKGRKRAAD
jgi:hypothetical protein